MDNSFAFPHGRSAPAESRFTFKRWIHKSSAAVDQGQDNCRNTVLQLSRLVQIFQYSRRWSFCSIRPDVLRFAVGLAYPGVGDGHGHGHAVVNAVDFEVESKIYSPSMAKKG
jgi:hypothetical protein